MNDDFILNFYANELNELKHKLSIGEMVGMNSAVLFQRMMMYFTRRDRKPFWKFKLPCAHRKYKPRDSWCEELGLKEGSFDRARDKIATKVTSTAHLKDLLLKDEREYCFLFFNDRDNVTWWYYNEKAVKKFLKEAYELDKKWLAMTQKDDTDFVDPLQLFRTVEMAVLLGPEEKNKINNTEPKSFEVKTKEVTVKKVVAQKSQKTIDYTNGIKLPIDFEIPDDIMETTLERGYEREDFKDQFIKFRAYYSIGKGKTVKSPDWRMFFTDIWLQNAYNYGHIKRNGKYKDSTNAPISRAAILKEQLKPGMFADVGLPKPRAF